MITLTRTITKIDQWGSISAKWELYIDGIYLEKYNESGISTKKVPFLLGNDLKGNMDNLRIYERVLTTAEINTLFNAKQ
jgi:hypothetical protein